MFHEKDVSVPADCGNAKAGGKIDPSIVNVWPIKVGRVAKGCC